MSKISYRFALPADADALVQRRLEFLAEGGHSPAESPGLADAIRAYFAELLPAGQFVAALAEADGVIVATGGMVFDRHPPRPKQPNGLSPYIMNVYVAPAYRRQGIATRLLEMLIARARESGATVLTLHHWPGKSDLYAKVGFKFREREMALEL